MIIKNFNSYIGKRLRSARQKHQLTQKKVAELLFMEENKISRIENGKQSADFEDIVKFSELYKKNIYYFLEDFNTNGKKTNNKTKPSTNSTNS